MHTPLTTTTKYQESTQTQHSQLAIRRDIVHHRPYTNNLWFKNPMKHNKQSAGRCGVPTRTNTPMGRRYRTGADFVRWLNPHPT